MAKPRREDPTATRDLIDQTQPEVPPDDMTGGITGGSLDDATMGIGADKDGNAVRKASGITGAGGTTVPRAGITPGTADDPTFASDPAGDSDLGADADNPMPGGNAPGGRATPSVAEANARDLDDRPARDPVAAGDRGINDLPPGGATASGGATRQTRGVPGLDREDTRDMRVLRDAGRCGGGGIGEPIEADQYVENAEYGGETVREAAGDRVDLPDDPGDDEKPSGRNPSR